MTEILLPLQNEISENEYQTIELFRERFKILWENWESLKSLGINFGGSFSNKEGDKKITGDSCNIDIFRLKGYFVDFRFFYGQKEPTNYFKVASMLGKKCNDPRFHKLLKTNKESWNEESLLHGWHKYSINEIFDCYFNGEVFHSTQEKRESVKELLSIMESDMVIHEMAYSTYNRMLVIRNLNWVLSPLNHNTQQIRLPQEHA